MPEMSRRTFLDGLAVTLAGTAPRAQQLAGLLGEDTAGQYHSIYDDFYFYTHFEDTDFAYGKALAQTGGEPVELLVFGIAKDMATKEELIAAPRPR